MRISRTPLRDEKSRSRDQPVKHGAQLDVAEPREKSTTATGTTTTKSTTTGVLFVRWSRRDAETRRDTRLFTRSSATMAIERSELGSDREHVQLGSYYAYSLASSFCRPLSSTTPLTPLRRAGISDANFPRGWAKLSSHGIVGRMKSRLMKTT